MLLSIQLRLNGSEGPGRRSGQSLGGVAGSAVKTLIFVMLSNQTLARPFIPLHTISSVMWSKHRWSDEGGQASQKKNVLIENAQTENVNIVEKFVYIKAKGGNQGE